MRFSALPITGFYMLGAYGVVGLVGVASIRLLTELAPTNVFGEANLVLTLLGLAITMACQPFTNTQLRYHVLAADQRRGEAFTQAALLTTAVAGSGVYAVTVITWVAVRCSGVGHLDVWGLFGLGGVVFATAARNVLYGRFQAEQRNFTYGALLAAEAGMIAGSTALGLLVRPSVNGYVIGHAIGLTSAALLGAVAAPRFTWRTLKRSPSTLGFLRRVWTYGAPFAPIGALGWLANLADRYVLGALMGAESAGRYVASFSIASRGMGLLGGAVGDLFRPALFAAVNQGDRPRARLIFWSWLGVRSVTIVMGVGGLTIFGPLIVRLLLAPAYRPGALPVMIWIAVAYGVQGIIQTLETQLMALNQTPRLILTLAVGGGANLLFSSLLIPKLGVLGAAQATTASFVIQAGVTALMLHRNRRALQSKGVSGFSAD
jgi:O-antigen/teichoic acid export membrane protein